jgi:hypothetical protein
VRLPADKRFHFPQRAMIDAGMARQAAQLVGAATSRRLSACPTSLADRPYA